jgi:pantetheine-phosphate adenylyltransferase
MNRSSKHPFSYRLVAVGGTFDVFHIGHRELLLRAFSLGDQVIIGVSSDLLASKLGKNHPIRPFDERVSIIRKYLKTRNWLVRARIVKINDPFGPAVKRKNLDALIVSQSTRKNATRLNEARRRNGLKPLKIHVVNLVRAEDGAPVSATRIRQGQIDENGRLLRTG